MKPPEENNTPLYFALAASAFLLVAALVSMKLFLHAGGAGPAVAADAGTRPAAPAEPAATLANSPALYQEELHADAQRFGLDDVDAASLAAPLTHSVELIEPRALRFNEVVETRSLRLRVRSEGREARGERGGFRAPHVILTIENLTDAPLAYRVETALDRPERCLSRGVLVHNAIALPARGRVERSECIFHPGTVMRLLRVETITLPPIGYFYLSQLVPAQLGLDGRTAEGHAPPRGIATCNLPYWREFAAWGLGWADLVDFFARHDCNKHGPFPEYRFRTAAGPLPAHR
jgi:hypothetical protein